MFYWTAGSLVNLRRRESRSRSVASSRGATPNPAWMRDDELMDANTSFFSGNAYAEYGPYDIDYTSPAGPSSSSCSATIPYDDPYADDTGVPNVAEREVTLKTQTVRSQERGHHMRGRRRGRGGGGGHRDGGYARGGGRGGRDRDRQEGHQQMAPPTTPVGIAQGTRQAADYYGLQHQQYSPLYPEQQHPMSLPYTPYTTYPMMMQMQSASTPFAVQPHINPRFASAFGLAVPSRPSVGQRNYLGGQGNQVLYGQGASASDWTEWSAPMQEPGSTEETNE